MMTNDDKQTARALMLSSGVDSMLALADLYEERSNDQRLIRDTRLIAQWAQILLPIWKRLSQPLPLFKKYMYGRCTIEPITVSSRRTSKLITVSVRTELWKGVYEYHAFSMKLDPRVMLRIDESFGNGWLVFRSKIVRIALFHVQSMLNLD